MRMLSFILLTALLFSSPLQAAEQPQPAAAATPSSQQQAQSPRDVIVEAVGRMTQRINSERKRLETEPGYAAKLVKQELDGLVAFKRITRLVMGDWFSQASREQKYRFLDVFKQSMIDTYASGVTLYEGQKIKVLPLRDGDIKGKRAYVRMELNTNSGDVIPVAYTMIKDDNHWLVLNVVVNGLNLGKTFRAQFAQSAEKHQGNLDQVIDQWADQVEQNKVVPEDANKS